MLGCYHGEYDKSMGWAETLLSPLKTSDLSQTDAVYQTHTHDCT